MRNLRNHFDRYAAGRIRPEKRATCCKGQADRGTERKVGGGQLGVGDGTADCGSGPGSPCWDREEHLKIQLTISLHAATQSARNRIIPHMRIYAIEDVVKQALSYSERHNRKIVFAYLLLPGINDRPSDVRQLAKWFRGKKVMINVLQYNPTSNSRIKAPQKREIVAFKHQLEQAGLEVTMRVSHGREINAACGQLANTYNKFKKK